MYIYIHNFAYIDIFMYIYLCIDIRSEKTCHVSSGRWDENINILVTVDGRSPAPVEVGSLFH